MLGLADFLPPSGRALDVAGGTGRHAIWLSEQGLDVTLADISPTALEIANRRAAVRGVMISTVEVDFSRDHIPPGPWDVILCVHYLQRDLFRPLTASLAPKGVLAVTVATKRNLQPHRRPPLPFLLGEGELPTLLGPDVEVAYYHEGWGPTGRHEANLMAFRAPSA